MSIKERRRLAVLEQVRSGHLTVAAAGALLGISERQVRRVWARFRAEGDAGLVHRLRGRPGNRGRDPSVRERAVALYREHYGDFGCTLACEYLAARHGVRVADQTLRRWLEAAHLWRRRRKRPVKRRRRERRGCFGELVQIDGSHHDWFEGRAACGVLMVMIDDATSWTEARFFEAETTEAAMTLLRLWSLAHGLPLELYPDQDSIYRINGKSADALEARTGQRPLTQFGRAMAELDVKLTCARSPQAKGRVERMNSTLQDRLIKALRIEGISDLASANAYLASTFLPQLNGRFTVEPTRAADVHRPTTARELDAALCTKDQRTVSRDQCVRWEGRILQLHPAARTPSLCGKRVQVRRELDGTLSVHWRHQAVRWQVLSAPPRPSTKPTLAARIASHASPSRPAAHHPWRRRPACGSGAPGGSPVGAGSATGSATPRPTLPQPQPAA